MDDADRKFTLTDRDLMKDFDPNKLDRVGKPIGVEEHTFQPEAAETKQAKASHTLLDMSKDYEFFTTGVIHAVTSFDRDPVSEFNRQYPPSTNDDLPVMIDYSQPFFEGLNVCVVAGLPVDCNRRIYAIMRDRFDVLRNTIAGIAMIDRRTGFYAKLNFYEMEIVDPFALKRMSVVTKLPTVPITVFGVSSNKGLSYLQGRQYPQLPLLVTEAAQPDVILEGKSVLGPPPSPEALMPKESK